MVAINQAEELFSRSADDYEEKEFTRDTGAESPPAPPE